MIEEVVFSHVHYVTQVEVNSKIDHITFAMEIVFVLPFYCVYICIIIIVEKHVTTITKSTKYLCSNNVEFNKV